MRWALLVLALLFAGLLYRGGVAFVSSFTGATASLQVPAPTTTSEMDLTTRPQRGPQAKQMTASGMARPEPSPAPQQGVASRPEDSSPTATEQHVFKARKALEVVDAREFLRQGGAVHK